MNIYIDYLDSPLGLLKIKADSSFIKSIEFVLEKSNLVESNNLTEACKLQLLDYFEDSNFLFSIPLSPEGSDFQKAVWNELLNIPVAETINYLQLAIRLGDKNKTRAVGSANGKNPIPILIPCHRVIGKNNELVGYSGGLWRKQWLLSHESKNIHNLQQSIQFE